eukprot:7945592-Pyramimonas_sp.AAC.1
MYLRRLHSLRQICARPRTVGPERRSGARHSKHGGAPPDIPNVGPRGTKRKSDEERTVPDKMTHRQLGR